MFFVSNLQSYSQAGRRRFESGLPLHSSKKINELLGSEKPQKTYTLFHYISALPDAFLFGIPTTFRPSTASSSFLAAVALSLRLLIVYSAKETPMPWPR